VKKKNLQTRSQKDRIDRLGFRKYEKP
jgi:hypothetical protein